MKFLILFAAAFGLVHASPAGFVHVSPAGFLRNTPEVELATQNFIREYNRLAKLAADAPDINIYHDDQLQRIDVDPSQQIQRPIARPPQGSIYSFTANLGSNRQFQPHQFSRTFKQIPAAPVHQRVIAPSHHRFTHTPAVQRRQPTNPHFIQVAPVAPWKGPFADTIPAGVYGLPQQVTDTPDVAAAKSAHFAILADAYKRSAARRAQHQFRA